MYIIEKGIGLFTIKNLTSDEAKRLCEYFKIDFPQSGSCNITVNYININLQELSEDIEKTTGIKLIF